MKYLVSTSIHGKIVHLCAKDFDDINKSTAIETINGPQYMDTDPVPIFQELSSKYRGLTFHVKYLFKNSHGQTNMVFEATNGSISVLEQNNNTPYSIPTPIPMSSSRVTRRKDELTGRVRARSLGQVTEIQLIHADIHSIDIEPLLNGVDRSTWEEGWNQFSAPPGRSHYKLLAYMSKHIHGDIIDIGTLTGASAIALSYNEENTVYTFDLKTTTFCSWGSKRSLIEVDDLKLRYVANERTNIVQKIGNVLKKPQLLLGSELIFLDIDHSGLVENDIVQFLIKNNWDGILIMDDTDDPVMQDIINSAGTVSTIHNLTNIGHNTGTVAMVFGERYTITA